MQLDVLSVLQLPATSGTQGGPFVLQDNGSIALQQGSAGAHRHAFPWLRPSCGFLACSRQSRYVNEADAGGVQFALVKEAARPSAWTLLADVDGQASSVRVKPFRGFPRQLPPWAVPDELPYDHLLGLGLPPTFERDDDEEGAQPGAESGPLSTSSCQVHVQPPRGIAGPRTQLLAHAYWRRGCPGKLVIAVMQRNDAAGPQQQQRGGATGRSPAVKGAAAAAQVAAWAAGSHAGGESSVGSSPQRPQRQLSWQWGVLLVTDGYEYVGSAVQQRGAAPVPSPRPGTLPVLQSVRMAWHPQGAALAFCLTDTGGRSCIALLDANLDVLWHLRWRPESNPASPAGSGLEAQVVALSWIRNTWLLALLDDRGQLSVLDASNQGGLRTASLVCGPIKYGQSTHLRLGHILGNAAAQPGLSLNDPTSRSARGCGRRAGSSSGDRGDTRARLPQPPTQRPGDQHAKVRYSLAFSVRALPTSSRTHCGGAAAAAAGSSASSSEQGEVSDMPGGIMAVCNGTAVALVSLNISSALSTPAADAAATGGALRRWGGVGDSAFEQLGKTSLEGLNGPTGGTAAAAAATAVDGDPDQDAVPALPGGDGGLTVDTLEQASSFGNSAVSTPYMLGLQRASSSSFFATPLATCRSNVSDAAPPMPWPLTWRTVLTLPPPGSLPLQAAAFGPGGAFAVVPSHWGPGAFASHGHAYSMAPSSIAPSSVGIGRPDRSLAGGSGAHPSPAGSIVDGASMAGGPSATRQLAGSSTGYAGGGGLPHGAAGTGSGSVGPEAVSCSWPEVGLTCSSPAALRALQAGDVLVLKGRMKEALAHYPRAHVYGFLPAFLALLHLHRVDGAARLLRAYAHLTGQVATAAAAAAADNPVASIPAAATLRQHWQAIMTGILEAAFTHEPQRSIEGAAEPVPGVQTLLADVNALHSNSRGLAKGRLQIVVEEEMLGGPVGRGEGKLATAAAAAAVPSPGGGGGTRVSVSPLQAVLVHNDGRTSGQSMVSVPENAVLEVAVASDDPGSPSAPLRPSDIRGHVHGMPSWPRAPPPSDGSWDAGAAMEPPQPNRTAADDAAEAVPPYSPAGSDGACDSSHCASCAAATGAALRGMLRTCLQLLLLACHAMAFVAFSGHGVARAAAAAADVLALPGNPTASPRSPGGGVLSRQAMRRLSSTVRMRSFKTRSASMFGNNGFGVAVTGAAPLAATGIGFAGSPPNALSPRMSGSHAAMVAATAGAAANVGTGGGAAAAVSPVVIGFPIPVVWQPQHPLHPQSSNPLESGPWGSTCGPQSQGQDPGPAVASGASGYGQSHVRTAAVAAMPSNGTACSVPLAVSGREMRGSSPGSPAPPTPAAASPLTAGCMRLQLHHCAFDVTRLWQDASRQQVSLGQSAAAIYLKPSYAAGLLLMAHACTLQLQDMVAAQHRREAPRAGGEEGGPYGTAPTGTDAEAPPPQLCPAEDDCDDSDGGKDPHPKRPDRRGRGYVLRPSTGAARVNWQLLRASEAATHAAAVWHHLADWHRAALLAFACANAMTQLGGGAAVSAAAAALEPRPRRASSVAAEHEGSEDGEAREAKPEEAKAEAQRAERQPSQPGVSSSGASGVGAEAWPVSRRNNGTGSGSGGSSSNNILAAARGSCLRMGQRVLMSQVSACQKMEVQDACGVLLELVALPRRLLGLHSAVHVAMLQKVCTRVADLLPARVCITPLLPAGSVPPLLQLSHAGIRSQLVAHCGAAVARVLEELRLAAACGGVFVSLRDAVQQIAEHATVDSCVRMLLRWQGTYDGSRVDAMAARLPENVQDMMLLPDTSDWSPEAVLPPLQDAFVASGLMSIADASAVVRAALAVAVAANDGHGAAMALRGGVPEEPPGPAGPGAGAGAGVASCWDAGVRELQDLDELALLLDLTQLQHTLLASLQPFLNDALQQLSVQLPGGWSSGSGGNRGGGEEHEEDVLVESAVLAVLPPVDLAVSCLKLLLKLQWAMHCRAQVCALMLRLARLQSPPAASPPPPPLAERLTASAAATAAAASPCRASPHGRHGAHLPRAVSLSTAPAHTPQRSFTHAGPGHRSFRDYIHQHIASGSAAAAIAAAGTAAPLSPWQSTPVPVGAAGACGDGGCSAGAAMATAAALIPLPTLDSQHAHQHPHPQPVQLEEQSSPFPARSAAAGVASESLCADGQVCPPPALLQASAAELETVQSSLLAWTAALVRADVFHSPSELQGCVLTVLTMIRSCPGDLLTALHRALQWREIPNKAIAEQIRRLQREATPSPQPAPPPQPAPATGTTAGATRRADSILVPGGAMAPAPSMLSPEDISVHGGGGGTRATADGGGSAVFGVAADEATASGGPDLSTALANAARSSCDREQSGEAQPGPQPAAVAVGQAAAAVPQLPSPVVTGVKGCHPMQFAVASAQADIRAASLKLLEYYADPSGAMPSGLSSAATLTNAGGRTAGTPTLPYNDGELEPPLGGGSAPPSADKAPRGGGVRDGGGGGGRRGVSEGSRRARHMLSRSQAVSRTTPHSTLLQCLVCELVRTAHSVTASVSWKATLEGGRGLAGCFVHPILHGGSSAAVASVAAAAAGGSTTAGTTATAATAAGLGPHVEEVESLGSVPRFVPCAEGAQALLLSLMDVREWADALKPQQQQPQRQQQKPRSSSSAQAGAKQQSAAPVAAAATTAGPSRAVGPAGQVVLEPASTPSRMGRAPVRSPAGEQLVADESPRRIRRSCGGAGSTGGAGGGKTATRSAAVLAAWHRCSAHVPVAFRESDTDSGMVEEYGRDDVGGGRLRASSATPPGSPSPSPSCLGNTGRLSFSALTDGDGDSCYPTPSATAGGGSADAKASADRHGNSSLRQHNNPAFGLHSPTPSNMSEFWEEGGSDLASPQSTHVNPGAATDSRPATSEGRTLMLWPAAAGGPSTAQAVLLDASSPQGTRPASPEPAAMLSGAHTVSGATASGLLSVTSGVAAPVSGGTPLSSTSSPLEARPAEHPQLPPAGSQLERSQLQAATRAAGDAGDSAAAAGEPGASATASDARGLGSGAGDSGSCDQALDGGSPADGEQLPTLSYLINVNALSEIRSAVKEARGEANAADSNGGDSGTLKSPSATADRADAGARASAGGAVGITADDAAAATARASPSTASGTSQAEAGSSRRVSEYAGSDGQSPPQLLTERSESFGAVYGGGASASAADASCATSVSELSVRGGVQGMPGGGGGWCGAPDFTGGGRSRHSGTGLATGGDRRHAHDSNSGRLTPSVHGATAPAYAGLMSPPPGLDISGGDGRGHTDCGGGEGGGGALRPNGSVAAFHSHRHDPSAVAPSAGSASAAEATAFGNGGVNTGTAGSNPEPDLSSFFTDGDGGSGRGGGPVAASNRAHLAALAWPDLAATDNSGGFPAVGTTGQGAYGDQLATPSPRPSSPEILQPLFTPCASRTTDGGNGGGPPGDGAGGHQSGTGSSHAGLAPPLDFMYNSGGALYSDGPFGIPSGRPPGGPHVAPPSPSACSVASSISLASPAPRRNTPPAPDGFQSPALAAAAAGLSTRQSLEEDGGSAGAGAGEWMAHGARSTPYQVPYVQLQSAHSGQLPGNHHNHNRHYTSQHYDQQLYHHHHHQFQLQQQSVDAQAASPEHQAGLDFAATATTPTTTGTSGGIIGGETGVSTSPSIHIQDFFREPATARASGVFGVLAASSTSAAFPTITTTTTTAAAEPGDCDVAPNPSPLEGLPSEFFQTPPSALSSMVVNTPTYPATYSAGAPFGAAVAVGADAGIGSTAAVNQDDATSRSAGLAGGPGPVGPGARQVASQRLTPHTRPSGIPPAPLQATATAATATATVGCDGLLAYRVPAVASSIADSPSVATLQPAATPCKQPHSHSHLKQPWLHSHAHAPSAAPRPNTAAGMTAAADSTGPHTGALNRHSLEGSRLRGLAHTSSGGGGINPLFNATAAVSFGPTGGERTSAAAAGAADGGWGGGAGGVEGGHRSSATGGTSKAAAKLSAGGTAPQPAARGSSVPSRAAWH